MRGSFPIEGDAGKRWAWTDHVVTTFPVGANTNKTFTITGWVPAATISKAMGDSAKDRVSVIINDKEVASKEFDSDDVFSIVVPWDKINSVVHGRDFANIEIRASRSFVPSDTGGSADNRRLALIIYSIKFR